MHLLNSVDISQAGCSGDFLADEPLNFSPRMVRRNHFGNHVVLNNGVRMPLLGLGTTHSGGYYHDSVLYALKKCGYRLIDTAKRYGVERELGIAIQESDIARDELFISTKLWPSDYGSTVRDACQKSCERLQTDYLDLYMTHFPVVPEWFLNPQETLRETWRQMELLYDSEVVRSIGVSNYGIDDLEYLLDYCSVVPHVNQCEFHPTYNPRELREFCDEKRIMFSGYCPLAKGRILTDPTIEAIAKKHDKAPAQICIRWSIENGVTAIPKSKEKSRILENSQVFDFQLTYEDHFWLEKMSEENPRKIIEVDASSIKKRMNLPDGYKLDAPTTCVSLEEVACKVRADKCQRPVRKPTFSRKYNADYFRRVLNEEDSRERSTDHQRFISDNRPPRPHNFDSWALYPLEAGTGYGPPGGPGYGPGMGDVAIKTGLGIRHPYGGLNIEQGFGVGFGDGYAA